MRLRLAPLGLLLLSSLLACASATSVTAPPVTAATASATPPPPAVPQNALELVPNDVLAIADIDLAAFAHAHDFALWRGWATRYACASSDELDWLFGTTQRAIAAAAGARPKTQGVVILSGKYTPADVTHALGLLAKLQAAKTDPAVPPAVASSARRGRFDVTTLGALAAAQLEGRLLIAGDSALVLRILDGVEAGTPGAFAASEPYHGLSTRLSCAGRAVCAVLAPGSEGTHILKHQLANVGMQSLGSNLSQVATGVMLDLTDGLALSSASTMASVDDAHGIEKQINDWLWQLGVFARLAGLPDVLDQIQVHVDGSTVELHLTLPPAALAQIESRVGDMLGGGEGACDASPQPTGPSAPAQQPVAAP